MSRASSPLTLAIFGGGGTTGKAAIAAARARGHDVRAIDHSKPDQPSQDPGVTHMQADVLDDDLREAVRGVDAVLSCLGVGNDALTLLSPPPLYTKGTAAICDAMEAEGVRRLVVISATFVATRDRGPIWFKLPAMVGLSRVIDQMEQMELDLRRHRQRLDWTAVRPGWLMAGPATGDYAVQADVIPRGMVRSRHADVAEFMVKLAEGEEWIHQTPALARHEGPEATSPEAVLKEMLG